MLKSKLVAFTLGSVVLVLSAQVNADPVTFAGTGLASTVTVSHNGTNLSVMAGEILVDHNSNRLTAYCVDLGHWITNSWTAAVAPVTSVNGGLAAAYLYDHFAASITNATQAAGLQIAIWEVVGDIGDTLNLSDGGFRFTGSSAVVNAAQGYLGALPSDLSGYTTSSYILMSGDTPRSQNLIVPEPAALALLTAGMLPTLLLGRRR